jgi:hypothetical protein
MTAEELAKVEDEHIDLSDVPELSDEFWSRAEIVKPDRTQHGC